MKKETALLCALILSLAGPAAGAQDWKLPVLTLKYEVTEGTIEDPDPDEDIQIPSALRNTVSLHLKETANPLAFGLSVRYSAKDYLLQSGDYSYLSLDQDSKLSVSDFLDLGLAFGGKWAHSPDLDSNGLSKDYLGLKVRAEAGIDPVKGTALDIDVTAEYDLHEATVKSRQFYGAGAGLTARLGEWLFSSRYRGVFRLPLGEVSAVPFTVLHEGSFSLQWDPNR